MVKSVLLLQMMDWLRDKPGLDISQLAAKMKRSPRTIYRYLETLSTELHIPVYCERGGYYIAERSVAGGLDLAPKEVLAVRLALTSVSMRKAGPFTEHALSAWEKIETALTSDLMQSLQKSVRRHSVSSPVFTEGDADPEVTKCLADAVERNRTVSIVYLSQRSGATKVLEINPFALVFRRHNWYLVAHSHTHGRTIQLKLVRVVKAEQTGESFELPQDFSIDSFYAKAWDMWVGEEERLVRVKFSPRVAQIIRESKRHPTQELKDTVDGGVMFSARVAGIHEIGFWILSFGADAEVIEPLDLRKSIEDTARKMVDAYASSPVPADDSMDIGL